MGIGASCQEKKAGNVQANLINQFVQGDVSASPFGHPDLLPLSDQPDQLHNDNIDLFFVVA